MIYLLAFLSGAGVLILETAGARLVSPFFGSTIQVWSSLISVTLLSLSSGYAIGGWAVDRRPVARTLYAALLLAGASLLPVPWLAHRVLSAAAGAGAPWGSLLSAALLLGPSISFLGSVGIIGVKLTSSHFENVGGAVGRMYAVTTLGGMAGALATGFWLLPNFGLRSLFGSMSLFFLGIGALGLAWSCLKPPGDSFRTS